LRVKVEIRLSRSFFTVIFFASTFLFYGGCLRLGPDYKEPPLDFEIPPSFQHAPKGQFSGEFEGKWWLVFNDHGLNEVVDDVLKNNFDIKKAIARVLEVRAQFKRSRADRFPDLSVQGSGERRKISVESQNIAQFGGFVDIGRMYNSFDLAFPVSYELDLWGRLSRAEEAAREELIAAKENYLTITQSLIAEAINLYFLIDSLDRRIQITEKSIVKYKESLSIVESRYERGLTSILDLHQARKALAQAEANLPPLRQELGNAQQSLAVLRGRFPETHAPRKHLEDYFKRLEPVPAGLPSELLRRRPDIKAAEANLKALNAMVGVAKASRFPSISLTGMFGYSSAELDQLFTPESELWSLACGLVQPIFNAGRLKAGQRAAEARYRQGVAEYAKTVLRAFAEVESALLTRKEQLNRREKVLAFLEEARKTEQLAESRYEKGLVDYLNVLEARIARYGAEESLIMVDYAILSNRVNLHRALGSGLSPLSEDMKMEEGGFLGF